MSLQLSSEQLSQAEQAITMLEQALGGLVSLAPVDRRRMVKMGQKSEVFCRQTLRVLGQNPQLVPPGLDLAGAQADLSSRSSDKISATAERFARRPDKFSPTSQLRTRRAELFAPTMELRAPAA